MIDVEAFARHSVYSNPGRHADALAAVPSAIDSLCSASRNVIAHYRAELGDTLPEVATVRSTAAGSASFSISISSVTSGR